MNAINRRVSRRELQLARCADNLPRDEHGRTAAERIWEARRSRMTNEELIVEERRMAVLHEACRGHWTIAEAIWRGQAALKKFAKMEAGQE
jgi:hypothetical protein